MTKINFLKRLILCFAIMTYPVTLVFIVGIMVFEDYNERTMTHLINKTNGEVTETLCHESRCFFTVLNGGYDFDITSISPSQLKSKINHYQKILENKEKCLDLIVSDSRRICRL